jgi:hypothetical protein
LPKRGILNQNFKKKGGGGGESNFGGFLVARSEKEKKNKIHHIQIFSFHCGAKTYRKIIF